MLRGGIGTFYDAGSGFLGTATFGFPFKAVSTLFFVPLPLSAQQAAPPPLSESLPAGANIYAADPKLRLPRTYQWNVAVEQGLGPNQVVSATYVGAAGRDLLRTDTLTAPNPDFLGVIVTRNTATSDYNALQLKYQRRLFHGLQALASYTLSHSIDISSNDGNTNSTPTLIANPNIDRGNSDFDVRHSVTAALSYDVPSPNVKLGRAIFEGWSIDNFVLARSAPPVDLIGNFSFEEGTEFIARPDVVSGQPLYLYGPSYPGGKAFNPQAFAVPASGQGDLGRNALRGFGAWQNDFTLRRQFPIAERIALQFRAEFFNVFNHPNFGPPGNSLGSPLFGVSTQTLASSLGQGGLRGGFSPLYQIGGSRSIQLALKLLF